MFNKQYVRICTEVTGSRTLVCTVCYRWVAEHYVKSWSERHFALLPCEVQRACLNAVTGAMVGYTHTHKSTHTPQLPHLNFHSPSWQACSGVQYGYRQM